MRENFILAFNRKIAARPDLVIFPEGHQFPGQIEGGGDGGDGDDDDDDDDE